MAVAVSRVNEALDASELDVTVLDALGFPATGEFTARVESEWMRVTAGQGTTTWTVTRGYANSTAATHADQSAIYEVPDTYPNLARIERQLVSGGSQTPLTAADRIVMADFIDQAHGWMVMRIGVFLGPTTATSIDLDGSSVVGGVLHIPIGIQSLTTLSLADATGGAFTAATAADLILGPRSWEARLPGQPYTSIRFKDVVTGAWSYFPSGYENVRVAGVLGWPEPPAELGEIGDRLVIRMFNARQTGQRDLVGSDDMGGVLVSRFLSARDYQTLDFYKATVSSFAYV